MKRYNIKSQNGKTEYIDILTEQEENYVVRFTRLDNGDERSTEETITKSLFNICLQTGYINPIPVMESSVA